MLDPIVLTAMTANERRTWPTDAERIADWLGAPYSATKWPIIDLIEKPGTGEPTVIDFEIPVAGGLLTEFVELYRVAKEFAWWMRQKGGKALNDSKTHAAQFREFSLYLAALTHRGIYSLENISPADHRALVEAWQFGNEILVGGVGTLELVLADFPIGQEVPIHFKLKDGKKWHLNRTALLTFCGIPTSGPLTKYAFDRAAERLGFLSTRPSPPERPSPTKTTKNIFKARQALLSQCYDMRHLLKSENFAFDPSVDVLADGPDVEPVPVAPPLLSLKLIAGCASYNAVHGPELRSRPQQERDLSWEADALKFAASVWGATASFTARRPEELRLMRRDCLWGNDEDGWFVHVFIVKNLNDWQWIPVPATVAQAIQNLIDLSPSVPMDSPLFAVHCPRTGKLRQLHIEDHLQHLAEEFGAVEYLGENDVPSRWQWTPRHFRRFTAVMYFYGYAGSIAVISHILRHFNLGQTWGYTRYDPSLDAAWKAVAEEFKREIATEAVKGSLDGSMGRQLVREAGKLEDRIRKQMGKMFVIAPDRLVDGVLEIMEQEGLVVLPKGWVLCSCPASATGARKAMCRRQAMGDGTKRQIGPDFAKAGPTVCPGCAWAIENEVTKQFASRELEALKLSCASPFLANTVFGGLQESQLVSVVHLEKVA